MQTQFLALAARVGGPGAQPPSSTALSDELAWANLHIFAVTGTSNSSTTRRKGGSSGSVGQVDVSSDSGIGCSWVRSSPRELSATLLAALGALVMMYVVRRSINYVIWWLQRRNLTDPSQHPNPETIPLLAWELQVLVLCFQGISEGAGEAISSKCLEYEVGGALVLLGLLLFLGLTYLVVVIAVKKSLITFERRSFRAGVANVKAVWADGKQKKMLHRISSVYQAWNELNERGRWEEDEEKRQTSRFQAFFGRRFLDRIGPLFDSTRGGVYWYTFWALVKGISTAIIIASVLSASLNAGLLLCMNVCDVFFILWYAPTTVWTWHLEEVYRSIINLSLVGSVFGYFVGWVGVDWFSNLFAYLAILSIIPSTAAAMLVPLLQFATDFNNLLSCWGAAAIPAIGATSTGGATGKAVTVMYADEAMHEQVLESAEKDKPDEDQGGKRRYRRDGAAPGRFAELDATIEAAAKSVQRRNADSAAPVIAKAGLVYAEFDFSHLAADAPSSVPASNR